MIAKRGSAVLFILLFTMIISISLLNRIRSASYMLDIARKREQFEEKYYITQTLLTIGVAYATTVDIKEKITQFSIPVDHYLSADNNCFGKVQINKNNTTFFIKSFLMEKKKAICALSCTVSVDRNSQSLDGRKGKRFVVSNFQQLFSAV